MASETLSLHVNAFALSDAEMVLFSAPTSFMVPKSVQTGTGRR